MDDVKKYFDEVKKIEKIYIKLSELTPLGFPKPVNLEKEKYKFFDYIDNGEVYNPQMIYEKTSHDVKRYNKLREKIDSIDLSNDLYGIKKLYKDKLISRELQVGYHKNWGTKLSSDFAVKYWKKPDLVLVLKAKMFCRNYKREIVKFRRVDYKTCGEELKKEVKRLTGDDITINYVKLASKVNIEPFHQTIQINKNEIFTTLDIERLKAHEIGVHYMRYYNARKFGIKLFEIGTEGYLETEEGLAAYNEYDKGVLSKAQMFVYAGRVLATNYCTSKSFYEIYNILKSYNFSNKNAFSITFRAKRNLCDTSQKGGFTKDFVYFKGFEKIKKFAKNNDVNKLFIGKVSIDNLKSLNKFIEVNYNKIDSPFKK
jgi:hypothetical protein